LSPDDDSEALTGMAQIVFFSFPDKFLFRPPAKNSSLGLYVHARHLALVFKAFF